MRLPILLCFSVCLALLPETPKVSPPGVLIELTHLSAAAQATLNLAAKGDSTAQFLLGRRYCLGLGVPPDYTEAAKWLRKAAEQGDANAQCELGFLYQHGAGVPKDLAEARHWYQPAAETGHEAALYSLGEMYFQGEGVARDRVQGYAHVLVSYACRGREFTMSGFEGLTEGDITRAKQIAVAMLKRIHPLAASMPQPLASLEPQQSSEEAASPRLNDLPEPAETRSAEDLSLRGQLLQLEYSDAKDRIQKRNQLLKAAAERGNSYAQTKLARAYEIGEGVPRDSAEAAKWYLKSAENGDADAQYNLGMMYANGEGVPKDDKAAQKWFQAASASLCTRPWTPEMKLRFDIEHRLTRVSKGYRFFLVTLRAGNPEAQACLDELEKTYSKNDLAASRWYADWVWRHITPD